MGDDPNFMGSSRRWITMEVENSLRRLGTDWIDLYQIHRFDPNVDLDETLGALTDLVRAGKIRYLGSSTYPAAAIVEAQWVAEKRQRERFVCEQPPYSILVRGIEAEVLPTCSEVRHGRHPVEPARRRLADRALPQGSGPAGVQPVQACPGPLRPQRSRVTRPSSTPSRSSRSSPTRPA